MTQALGRISHRIFTTEHGEERGNYFYFDRMNRMNGIIKNLFLSILFILSKILKLVHYYK